MKSIQPEYKEQISKKKPKYLKYKSFLKNFPLKLFNKSHTRDI